MNTTIFIRRPRLAVPRVPGGEVNVQPPPEIPRPVPSPIIAKIMPLVMVVAMVGMIAFFVTSGSFGGGAGGGMMRNPMFMLFPIMMMVSMVSMVSNSGGKGAKTSEINEDRKDYLRYLEVVRKNVTDTGGAQRKALLWNNPDPSALWTLAGGRRMWERRPGDSDYCHVRVGVGDQRLAAQLVAPEIGPVEELEPVASVALRRFVRTHSLVPELPIALNLRGFAAVTIDGSPEVARGMLRAMICQLAMFHGPDQFLVAAVVNRHAAPHWDWLKWLPHAQHPSAFDGVGSSRLVYHSLGEVEESLASLITERERFSRTAQPSPDRPQILIIVDSGTLIGSERLIVDHGIDSVTLVEIGTRVDPLAARRGMQLELTERGLGAKGNVGSEVFAHPDHLTITEAMACARRLAPYRVLTGSGDEVQIQTEVSTRWSDIVGIGDPGLLNPEVVWRNRVGRDRLRVPIGIAVDGTPMELDIKEAAENGMGPHGLCIGATGSGKSEFLRTLTLGMIATHSPDALNLVLVDFKGGATFLGLDRAQHVAAIITNLAEEANLVSRMKDALAGEMNRRQELLRAAGNFANVTEYERARAAGASLAPLPALFIIVDEFSELLSQHPDFAELFVAIGRLGRSLHVHLLLASQRLDEGRLRGLESHLSYRLCLKTFSANESRAAIGVPDAYHLPNTPGSCYLKDDSGELTRFQTSYVSGAYVPYGPARRAVSSSGSGAAPRLFTAAPVALQMRPTEVVEDDSPATTEATGKSVIDTILDRVEGHGNPAHEVWLPPLDDSPTLGDLIPRHGRAGFDAVGSLTVPIGIVDRPYEQRRDPYIVDLSAAAGNVAIVGAPQSGKSMAVRTLVTSLAVTHSPAQVQFYCLDFGGGTLTSLSQLPHVGSVASRLESDLIRRTFAEMLTIVRSRENAFRAYGIDSMAEYRRRKGAGDPQLASDPFGDVFFIIDGWSTVRQEFEALEPQVTALAAQGLGFGVHTVVTASRWAEIRPALKDQIGTRVELRLGDPLDSDFDRKLAQLVPDGRPGRGITRDRRHMLIGLPRVDSVSSNQDLGEAIGAAAASMRQRSSAEAPQVRMLPHKIDYAALVPQAPQNDQPNLRILVGINETELAPTYLEFGEQPHMMIFGDSECGKTGLLRTMCREIVRTTTPQQVQLFIVDYRRTLLGVVETEHLGKYAMSSNTLVDEVPALIELLKSRMPGPNVTQQELRDRSWWSGPEIYILVDDYDLVALASGNPLLPLAEYLPHSKDIGLHVVIARRTSGASRAMFEPVMARMKDLSCIGLQMSGNKDEGVLLGTVRPSEQPPGRGTLVMRSGGQQLIQVAWSDSQ
ncbi:S-DNA-T family DNA segregation ATPase FtsK/SpoIIIE [Mycobacteroides chelonae]|nr:S-DNA-T family DNA segregation ATPase FtsK/SpoIIIE [Mycobacteroides chelonae]